jgi:hypothetical protein
VHSFVTGKPIKIHGSDCKRWKLWMSSWLMARETGERMILSQCQNIQVSTMRILHNMVLSRNNFCQSTISCGRKKAEKPLLKKNKIK